MHLPITDEGEMRAIVNFATQHNLNFDRAYFKFRKTKIKDLRRRYAKEKGVKKFCREYLDNLQTLESHYRENPNR